jgi:hypothetical protein
MVSRKFRSAIGLPSFSIVLLGVYVAGRRPPEAKALSSASRAACTCLPLEAAATSLLFAPREVVPRSTSVKFDQLTTAHDIQQQQQILPPSGITLHSVFDQSQNFQILTKHIGKTINNYETKYRQYENIFYDNSNDGYFIL